MLQHHSLKGLLFGTGFESPLSRLSPLLLLVILLIAPIVTATEDPPSTVTPPSNPGESANQGSYTGNIGDIINLFDGSLSLSQVDVSLPGRAGLDLMLTRRYSSNIFSRQDVASGTYDNNSWGVVKPHGCLGDGWDMTIGRYDDNTKTIFYGDGSSEEYFSNTGLGQQVYPYRTVSGNRLNRTQRTLRLLNGTRYVYDKDCTSLTGADTDFRGWYLTEIIDVFGNNILITYKDGNFPFIESIQDALGRTVQFEYSGSDRTRQLYKVKYLNYNSSIWLEVVYHYLNSGQLDCVTYPNGDAIHYGYTATVLKPDESSYTLSGDTRVLSSVTTTRGGVVSYAYKLFQEQREFGDSLATYHHYDTTWAYGSNCAPPADSCISLITESTTTELLPAYRYVNHWSVSQRVAVAGMEETTTFAHTLDNGFEWGTISPVRHKTTVTTPRGETLDYYFSINTDVRDWFRDGNSSHYYRRASGSTDDVQVKPGSLYHVQSSMVSKGGIHRTLLYHCVAFNADSSAPYLVIPANILDERAGGPYVCTAWTPNSGCFGVGSSSFPFYELSSTATYKKNYVSDTDAWTTDIITGSSFDTLLNIYRVAQRTVTDYRDGNTESIVTNYRYSSDLRYLDSVTTVRGGDSVTVSYRYDTVNNNGNVTKSYDANGLYTMYTYDTPTNAFVTQTSRQPSLAVPISQAEYYSQAGLPVWTMGAHGDATYYTYDNYNRLTSVQRPLEDGISSYREYLPASNSIRDSVKTTSSAWRVTETKYDGFNNVIRTRVKLVWNSSNSEYHTDSTTYDTEGRVNQVFQTRNGSSAPDLQRCTAYTYDALGRVVHTSSFAGESSINYIDFYTTETTDAAGRRVKTVRDFSGNVIATHSNYHDSQYHDHATSTYLPFGKRQSTIPPKGSAYADELTYDAFGNVSSRTNPDEGMKHYYYNKLGQLRLTQDAGGTFTYFKYDGWGRITQQGVVGSVSDPVGAAWNSPDFPTADTTQSIRKRYDGYTAAASEYCPPQGSLEAPFGLLTQVDDPTGHTYFYYDLRGRVVKKVTYVNGDTVRIHECTYHPGDMVDWMYYPKYDESTADADRAIQYDYYDYGWTRGVSGYTSSPGITYEPYGAVKNMLLKPSGSYSAVDIRFIYDEAGRLNAQFVNNTVSNNDAAVFRRSYAYSNGDLYQVKRTDNVGGDLSPAQTYTYDFVGRLSTAEDQTLSPTRNYTYTYDGNGNLNSVLASGSWHDYTYEDGTNRLLRSGWGSVSADFDYDDNGCLHKDPQKGTRGTFMYPDYRNLDTLVTQFVYSPGDSNLNTLRMSYDYTGRLVKKTAVVWTWEVISNTCKSFMSTDGGGGDSEIVIPDPDPEPEPPAQQGYWTCSETSTYYYYSGSEVSLVVRRKTNSPVLWTINIYAAGKKIATADYHTGSTLTKAFEVSDYQGNLRNVFAYYTGYANPQLTEAIWYNPFGKQDNVWVAGITPHRFSYNGKELDEALDLDRYYYGARYYDPQIGRFMTPDPVNDDWTPYSYVCNNPIMNIDPTGMMTSGGGGLVEADDPCPGFNYQSKDPFALLDAGKMQLPRWAVRQYMWNYGPTGGNRTRGLNDDEVSAIALTARLSLESGKISQEQFDRITLLLKNGRIGVDLDMQGQGGWSLSAADLGDIVNPDPNINGLFEGEHMCISTEVADMLTKGSNLDQLAAFSVVVHEVGHSLSDWDRFGKGQSLNAPDSRGYADQAEFWKRSGFYQRGGTGRLNKITDWYQQSGGKNNSLFFWRLGWELRGTPAL